MREKALWDDWTTCDEDGFLNGIREDAPEDVKKEFNEYWENRKKMIEHCNKNSICIEK